MALVLYTIVGTHTTKMAATTNLHHHRGLSLKLKTTANHKLVGPLLHSNQTLPCRHSQDMHLLEASLLHNSSMILWLQMLQCNMAKT